MKIFITGGSGFIGSCLIRHIINGTDHRVFNFDKLTYASNSASLSSIQNNPRYEFLKGDIIDLKKLSAVIKKFKPDIIMNLAAESHVDRSILTPAEFINTNIIGTYNLLEVCRSMRELEDSNILFHHISTDEVFGSLDHNSKDLFHEEYPYSPSSPYSASKAASDHLVRAWGRTYGIKYLITNCSNNYGPFQHEEKLIPKIILSALNEKEITIYGDGSQIRDWIFVEDHVRALLTIVTSGEINETFNIGASSELRNIDIAKKICKILDQMTDIKPSKVSSYEELITFVDDRPGHDIRYAINASKIRNKFNWKPHETFISGLNKTVEWYIDYYKRFSK